MNALPMLAVRFFDVSVSVHDGIWTAECDALGLVTEADSYDKLIDLAWEIAPELAELNDVGVDAGSIRLRFTQEQSGNRSAG